MSSPPPSASSPTGPSFSVPRKRPALAAANPTTSHRRKPSSVASFNHPLRQTSFPPPGATSPPQFSPTRNSSFSPSVTSVGGRGVGSRKRRRDARSVTDASVVKSAADPTTKPGSTGKETIGQRDDDEGEEDENDGADDTVLEGGGMMDEATRKQEREHLAMLIDAFSRDQADRYDTWRRVRLKKETVRRIANQTLSQSVPASIVTTINGYTKLFIGELVERARDVQLEWLAAKNAASQEQTLRLQEQMNLANKVKHSGDIDQIQDGHPTSQSAMDGRATVSHGAVDAAKNDHGLLKSPKSKYADHEAVGSKDNKYPGETAAKHLYHVDEGERGPLTPDHLREALRRYKKDQEGGGAGFQGLSIQGKELAGSRVGGKRTFR